MASTRGETLIIAWLQQHGRVVLWRVAPGERRPVFRRVRRLTRSAPDVERAHHLRRVFMRCVPSPRQPEKRRRAAAMRTRHFDSRRSGPAPSEGRWALVSRASRPSRVLHDSAAALARQLLARHGVLRARRSAAEGIDGGFTAIYPALKAMDDAGARGRGYFVADSGATQFALRGALDLLRSLRQQPNEAEAVVDGGVRSRESVSHFHSVPVAGSHANSWRVGRPRDAPCRRICLAATARLSSRYRR